MLPHATPRCTALHCGAQVEMSNGVRADISIGTDAGPRAAAYLVEAQARFPVLRPLAMAVKVGQGGQPKNPR